MDLFVSFLSVAICIAIRFDFGIHLDRAIFIKITKGKAGGACEGFGLLQTARALRYALWQHKYRFLPKIPIYPRGNGLLIFRDLQALLHISPLLLWQLFYSTITLKNIITIMCNWPGGWEIERTFIDFASFPILLW